MASLLLADRVKDSTTTTGTGDITLSGSPPAGYQSFNTAFGTSANFYYCITGGSEWEVGQGHLSASTTLVRDLIFASSNSGSAVSFSAGTKDVFCTIPASAAGRWNTIFKKTNETRTTNTTLANDTELQFAVAANAVYSFKMHVITYSGAGNLKYALAAPGSLTGRSILRQHGDTTTAASSAALSSPPSSTNMPNAGVHGYIKLQGVIETGASSGTVAFQFAQVTSNADPCYSINGGYISWCRVSG